jgi:hypothetical protein
LKNVIRFVNRENKAMHQYANGKGGGTSIGFQRTHKRQPKPRDIWDISNAYFNPELESEWEIQESGHYVYSSMLDEVELDTPFFLQGTLHNIRKIAQATTPIARQMGAIAARTLMQTASGLGNRLNSRTNRLLKTVLWEGDRSAAHLEAEWFGYAALEMEISPHSVAYDAALSEVLAAEASHTHSEREATTFMGAVLPITLRIMGEQWIVRPVTPALLNRTVRLVHLLCQRGPAGRRLLRLLPSILRRTILSLQTFQYLGYPLSSSLVGQVMASHTDRVFGNPRLVSQLITRNAVIRQRTVSVH